VGELLAGHYGFVCMHGVYVMGTFIPGSMTYFNGNIQVCMFISMEYLLALQMLYFP